MIWLIAQMWLMLIVSGLIGLGLGFWIWHRTPVRVDIDQDRELAHLRARCEESEAEKTRLRSKVLEMEHELDRVEPTKEPEYGPVLYDAPSEGEPDDLKLIKGIGPQIEKTLNEMGIHYYHQIAGWTDSQAKTIDEKLSFKGRIERDDWRRQAAALARNGQSQLDLR